MKAVEVGTEIPALRKTPVDRVQLVRYASASRDFNRIHFDHLFAQEAGQPSVIAHGMLIMGFLGELVTRWGGAGSVRKLEARFQSITYPGDEITCRGRVTEATGQLVQLEVWAEKADGSKAATGTAEVWLREARGPQPPGRC